MGAWEFDWGNVPAAVLDLLPPESASSGALPGPELGGRIWPQLRDEWLLPSQRRTSEFANLLDSLNVARTTRDSAPDDTEFLRRIRNSAGLRHAIVTYLIALGSQTSGSTGDGTGPATNNGSVGEQIPSPEFAPRSNIDFSRLSSMVDLEWSQWVLRTENAVETLRPGSSIVVMSFTGEAANDAGQEGVFGVNFERISDVSLGMALGPEGLLPQGVTYDPMWNALQEVGWEPDVDGRPMATYRWPEDVDRAIAIAEHTLRWICLVQRPLSMAQSDELPAPQNLLPAPPLPEEVIRPAGPSDVLAVVDAIVREMGGSVLSGADANTHGFRLGAWAGWLHAGINEAVLDIVVVAHEIASPEEVNHEQILNLQAQSFRYGRTVVTGGQAMVVASLPCQAFTGQAVQTLLYGLIEDAAALNGATDRVIASETVVGLYL